VTAKARWFWPLGIFLALVWKTNGSGLGRSPLGP